MTKRLAGAHVLSVKQFDRELLDDVFAVARNMRVLVRSVGTADLLKGRVLTNLFYESSTRTSSSFAAAILRLGGSVVPINDVNYSSVTKGETLEDTVRTLEAYGDALVLRHPELGAAARAAAVATKPVINAGDGPGEHPPQALLDLFTILTEKLGADAGSGSSAACLGGLRVALVGDLRHGRTVHSLSRLLALYGAELHYGSPELLRMPEVVARTPSLPSGATACSLITTGLSVLVCAGVLLCAIAPSEPINSKAPKGRCFTSKENAIDFVACCVLRTGATVRFGINALRCVIVRLRSEVVGWLCPQLAKGARGLAGD